MVSCRTEKDALNILRRLQAGVFVKAWFLCWGIIEFFSFVLARE